MIKQKLLEYKSNHPAIFKLVVFFLLISTISIFAAVLSGPSNPTVNSIATYMSNKQLTNTGIIIDANSNIYNINGLTGVVMNLTTLRATNFIIGSNALSSWPATPTVHGDAYFGNSNGVIYLLTSTNTGSLTWTKTNLIAP